MTEWKQIQGTQTERPLETDTTSSPTTVYQRRNIDRVKIRDNDGDEREVWEYEERELSISEYEEMLRSTESPAIQGVMQQLSSIELSIALLSIGEEIL